MEQPRSQAYFRKLVYYVMDLVLRLDRLLSDAFRFSFLSTLESTQKRPSSQSRFPTSVSSSTIWLPVACRVSALASWKPFPTRCCTISASPPSSARSCLHRPRSPTPSASARLSSCYRWCCRRCRQYPLLAVQVLSLTPGNSPRRCGGVPSPVDAAGGVGGDGEREGGG